MFMVCNLFSLCEIIWMLRVFFFYRAKTDRVLILLFCKRKSIDNDTDIIFFIVVATIGKSLDDWTAILLPVGELRTPVAVLCSNPMRHQFNFRYLTDAGLVQ